MIDITHKITTLRKATASAIVQVSRQETIDAILHRTVPKGDVLAMSKAAGLLAVKKTADVIPDCHPLPIEYTSIEHTIEGLKINILVEVACIYRTGVEVEAMHGASIVALTMYDMLKPIDKEIEISSIRLVAKKGGKSDLKKNHAPYQASVIVCSDSISRGNKEDRAGKIIIEKLKACQVVPVEYVIIPDETETLRATVQNFVNLQRDLILITGGTGLSPRDNTPEAITPMLDREIPGVMEAARNYGQERTPYAMLSRGVAGTIGNTVVIAMPGSTNGAKETMDALFPQLLHLFPILKNERHD